ncbi:MAG TPA: hypothetical protein VH599_02655 [Ktedonobacterales bacterium]|jgi:hypothetical protein
MNREEDLDRLIEQRLSDASWQPDMSDDEAARIAAAQAILRLNTVEPPPALTERIESRIRARARAHHNGHIARLRLLPRAGERSRRVSVRRAWVSALSAAAVLLLAFFGVTTAAARSLPGDLLYGLKSWEQQIALASAGSPADRANIQISQLQSALADLETVVGDGRSDADITQALTIVAADTRDSQAAVAATPAGPERDAAEQSLAKALQGETMTLYRLLKQVGWSLRLAFTQQLGALGVPIPTVTQVSATEGSNDTVTLTLTGTNFAPGARLVINGRALGTVSQNSATTLIAMISHSDWRDDKISVGVLNPDGTAAQKIVNTDDDHHDGSGGDDHGGQGTPGSTPEPGDDGGHGGGGDDGGSSGGGDGSGGGNSGPGGGGGSEDGSGTS